MGPEIELLEHHRQVGADAQHLFGIGRPARQPASRRARHINYDYFFISSFPGVRVAGLFGSHRHLFLEEYSGFCANVFKKVEVEFQGGELLVEFSVSEIFVVSGAPVVLGGMAKLGRPVGVE